MIQDRRRWVRAPLGVLVLVVVLAGHAPLVAVHANVAPAATSMPGVWDTRIGTPGMDRPVFALTANEAHVYAGGNFTAAGGQPAARMAHWNGSAWQPMGDGIADDDGEVFTITPDGQDGVYVGGMFGVMVDGTPAYSVAHWTSTRWEAVPTAVGGIVDALLVLDTHLYVAGSYNPIIGGGQCCLVYWDGTEWWSVRPGPERRTSALAADGKGGIYVAGDFLTIGATQAAHIAHWNRATGQWTPLGTGTNHTITALAVDPQGQLYAGGMFSQAGGAPAYFVARWNGAQWAPLGLGTNGPVSALAVAPDGGLYAGGEFTAAGGLPASHLAYWNGQQWSALGQGTNGPVHALTIDARGVLTVGGNFTQAGGQPAARVAQWIANGAPLAPAQWLPVIKR